MARAMSVEDAQDEGAEAGGNAGLGALARVRATVSARIGLTLDAVIAALQRQRARLLPLPDASAAPVVMEEAESTRPSKARRILRGTGIGALVLLVGAMGGAWFAFNSFAQKIERQNQLIADQADEMADYRMDAERAERVRDDARAELRDMEHELVAVRKDYEEAKSRLAEIEGRTLMYGSSTASAPPPARSPYTTSRSAPPRGQSGECALSSVKDLSRCLSHSK